MDFVLDPRKKISYAPSFGVNEIRNQYVKDEIGKQLKSFSALSVREKQGSDMIKEYYGLQANVVIDPTLLLNANDWDTMCGTEAKKDRALLCYVLGENEKVWKNIRQIAKKIIWKYM